MTSGNQPAFAFDSPGAALAAFVDRIEPVETERCALHACAGRVLGAPTVADRPSPAADVSAMDGYAVRIASLDADELAVAGAVRIGLPPPAMPSEGCLHIVTGAPVPEGADAVVRREDVEERGEAIGIGEAARRTRRGANIRRRAENIDRGDRVMPAGEVIDGPRAAALSLFGVPDPEVRRRVRVRVIVTGDEVRDASDLADPWEVRDANGPALRSMLSPHAWLEPTLDRATDDPRRLREAVDRALDESDAILLTGGVSMGDRDYVPSVLRDAGCETVFHKLPQRPGKPMLGAVAPGSRPVLGLPGNPVSVLVTARRYAMPSLARRAGLAGIDSPQLVRVAQPDSSTLGLWWFRLVRLEAPGLVSLVESRGSGDVSSAARSDGFVEVGPHTRVDGELAYYGWNPR